MNFVTFRLSRQTLSKLASYKRSNQAFWLTNFTNVTVVCNSGRHFIRECIPCIVHIDQCDCHIRVQMGQENMMIHQTSQLCARDTEKIPTRFYAPVNLAIFQKFYKICVNETLKAHQHFHPDNFPVIQSLNLTIQGEEMHNLLAPDEQLSFSLKKISRNLKNQSMMLTHSAEHVLFDYFEQQQVMHSFPYFEAGKLQEN